jgi:molecular chaperone GrpE
MADEEQRQAGEKDDLEAAMKDAVAAVEEVERRRASKKGPDGAGGSAAEEASAGEAAAASGEPGKSGDEEVERLRKEVASLKDISMRTLADFDNYRKRIDRERQDQKRYALTEPLREFLPVVDNLERALGVDAKLEDLRVGLEMVHQQMVQLLERFGAKPVPAAGEPFDPNLHDAVSRVEDDEVKVPTVREEHQRGYLLHERLLRPAMVTVAMPAMPPAEAPAADEEPEG